MTISSIVQAAIAASEPALPALTGFNGAEAALDLLSLVGSKRADAAADKLEALMETHAECVALLAQIGEARAELARELGELQAREQAVGERELAIGARQVAAEAKQAEYEGYMRKLEQLRPELPAVPTAAA